MNQIVFPIETPEDIIRAVEVIMATEATVPNTRFWRECGRLWLKQIFGSFHRRNGCNWNLPDVLNVSRSLDELIAFLRHDPECAGFVSYLEELTAQQQLNLYLNFKCLLVKYAESLSDD